MWTIGSDLKVALRGLVRAPTFSLVALLTLAIGIGACVSILSVVYGVLLKPLPYTDPDRLVVLDHRDVDQPTRRSRLTPGTFSDLRARTDVFASVAGYAWTDFTLETADQPERLEVTYVVGGFFDVLRVPPLLGRSLDAADDVEDGERVAVLSHGLWQRGFGADDTVLGRTARLEGVPYTIVGVMPPGFRFPRPQTELWIPSRLPTAFRGNRTEFMLEVVARLAPEVTPDTARGAMDSFAAALREAYPESNADLTIGVEPLQRAEVAGVERKLSVLLGAAGFVLLVACANLAHLALGRANRRRREMALRQALGADRWRLLRLVSYESAILSAAGLALGLALGGLALRLILAFAPADLPRLERVSLFSEAVIPFSVLALALALVFAVLPAVAVLGRGGAGLLGDRSGGHRYGWLRGGLVIAEVTFAVVLLAGAGLLVRSLLHLTQVDPGFRAERVLAVDLDLPMAADGTEREARNDALLAAMASLPGVEGAALANQLPLTGAGPGAWLQRADRPRDAGGAPPAVRTRAVAGDYFRTLGVELVAGRLPNAGDARAEPVGAVINQAAAQRFWPGEDPVGKVFALGPDGSLVAAATVIGVVRDVANTGLAMAAEPVAYLPAARFALPMSALVVRASVAPESLAGAVRQTLQAAVPGVPIGTVQPLEAVLGRSLLPTRSLALLLGVFSAVGLVLAAVGVFSVLAVAVSDRRRELAIRAAIGADASNLVRGVVARGLALTGSGLVLGLIASLALTRTMTGILYGVRPIDPLTFVAVAIVLALAAGIASYLPARRAATTDPLIVLRAD